MLVTPGNVKAIESNIIKLLSEVSLRKALSDNGKLTFENKFMEEIVVKKYVNLFNSVFK